LACGTDVRAGVRAIAARVPSAAACDDPGSVATGEDQRLREGRAVAGTLGFVEIVVRRLQDRRCALAFDVDGPDIEGHADVARTGEQRAEVRLLRRIQARPELQ